jgi:hypothetical protein
VHLPKQQEAVKEDKGGYLKEKGLRLRRFTVEHNNRTYNRIFWSDANYPSSGILDDCLKILHLPATLIPELLKGIL